MPEPLRERDDDPVALLFAFLRDRRKLSFSAQDVPTDTGCEIDDDEPSASFDVDHCDLEEFRVALPLVLAALTEAPPERPFYVRAV